MYYAFSYDIIKSSLNLSCYKNRNYFAFGILVVDYILKILKRYIYFICLKTIYLGKNTLIWF
ncbi:hypothetical protein UT300019_20300 [Clostridium sp. CTA-19]